MAISIGAAVTSQTRWPCVEVQLRQRPGAGPDPVGHHLVEDLLAELLELVDRVPAMKESADARASAMCSGSSTPTSRK